MFPLPLAYLMTTPAMMEQYIDKADAFDGLFNMILGYGIQFLLPCIIGVVAAMLFFIERDNDTFKNIKNNPIIQYASSYSKNYSAIYYRRCILHSINGSNSSGWYVYVRCIRFRIQNISGG